MKRITGSWLTFASVDVNELEQLLTEISHAGHDIVKAGVQNEVRFWLRDVGQLKQVIEGSPVIVYYPPRRLADRLWTIGRFLFPQPQLSKTFPEGARIRNRICKHLKNEVVIWTRDAREDG